VPDVIEAVLDTYRDLRQPGEHFIDALRRIGHDPSSKPPTARATPSRPKKPCWPKPIPTRILL
jgi:sulfite reductase (NADPH) hemoprotein beta-component